MSAEVCTAGERERIVAGTERGDLLVVEGGDLRLALPFEGAPAVDAIQATPKAICASCIHCIGFHQKIRLGAKCSRPAGLQQDLTGSLV